MIRNTLAAWRDDGLLRRVVRNSSYLFSSNGVTAALSFVQGILAVRLLGISGFGLVSGAIIVFASNVNNLLSFRMSDVVVKYLGEALTHEDRERAAVVVKGIAMAEACTSVFAYLVLLLLAPWAARTFAKDASTAPLFTFYGLVLLANLVYETSTGVLRAARRFDRLAVINLLQSLLTFAIILAAFITNGSLTLVLTAYLAGKTLAAVAIALSAFTELNRIAYPGWIRVPLRQLRDWREIARFAVSTNLNGTINLIVRDSAPLFLVAFRSTTEGGYYRLAANLVLMAMMPIDLFIWPTYTEIARTVATREWKTTRQLLRRVSTLAAGWVLAAGGGLALLGGWLIPLVYKPESAPAYPAVLILLIGYGFANIYNWNRPLLLALGHPVFPSVASGLVGLVEIGLVVWLVPLYGYQAQAALLSGFFIVSIGLIVWRGLREVSRREAMDGLQLEP